MRQRESLICTHVWVTDEASLLCVAFGRSLLHLSHDGLEGLRVIDSEVSEDLTVDLDTLSVQSTHQTRVRESLQTSSGIDTLDPECTEVALLVLTVTEGVGETLFPSILGDGPDVTTSTVIATSELEDALTLRTRSYVID